MSLRTDTKLNDILAHWADIEGYIKQVEAINGKFITATINELRYAGRLLVSAMNTHLITKSSNENDFYEKLIIARQYLYNAEHDLTDSVIAHYSARCRKLNELFGTSFIISKFPDYKQYIDTLSKAKYLIQKSRRSPRRRVLIYKLLRYRYVGKIAGYEDNLLNIGVYSTNMLELYSRQSQLNSTKYDTALKVISFLIALNLVALVYIAVIS